jgi:hypothetical protein
MFGQHNRRSFPLGRLINETPSYIVKLLYEKPGLVDIWCFSILALPEGNSGNGEASWDIIDNSRTVDAFTGARAHGKSPTSEFRWYLRRSE